MCGIVGYVNLNGSSPDINIDQLSAALYHRGPDGYGSYFGSYFALGHRRLAILDVSDAGRQPMEYLDRYVIVFNGEIYNYLELKTLLSDAGYTFRNHTDTEVIMAAYDFWGPACLSRFNGMWAFLIYDVIKDNFFISRDRFGIKPLYYYKDDNHFVFSSEIKALVRHPVVELIPNMKFVKDYISSGPTEYLCATSFSNIYKFPQASYLIADREQLANTFAPITYWKLKVNLVKEKFSLDKAQCLAEQYYELLLDSVRLRMRSDVPIGSALSGGLDSSSIVYLINQQLQKEGKQELQKTFSSVYETPGTEHCNELPFILATARFLGVDAHMIEPIESEIPVEHEKMIWMMENPPESTCMSGWHTFKLVRRNSVTVTLDGQGADEQLAGYLGYIFHYLISLRLADFYQEFFYFLKRNYLRHVIKAFAVVHLRFLIGDAGLSKLLGFFNKRYFSSDLNDVLAIDTISSLVTLIHYSDHVSMAHSVESRMPFMDYRVVEFLAQVPACYKMHRGWTKYLARLAFDGKLPHGICWRKDKMGWPIPEDYWFRGKLKSWFVEEINKSVILKEIDPDFSVIREIEKKINITSLVRYLNIAVWEKLFFRH